MATNNAINLKTAGVVTYDGVGGFTGSSVTQHGVVVAGASNALSTVAPSTSGNVLTSNGTDWTSAAPPGGGLLSTGSVTWSNAALKAGTALTLVASAGAGVVIVPVQAVYKFNYGGTNAFTSNPTADIGFGTTQGTSIKLNGPSSIGTFWMATANEYYLTTMNGITLTAVAAENTAIYARLSAALTGNAAGNNTVTVQLIYYTVTL
jgi:hypothetical protein